VASEAGAGTGEALPIQQVGSAVSVVTRDELRRRQVRDAAEALRSLPGVSVSRTGSISGKVQVRLRGNEGNHTLVLVDGIELNDPNDGEFDFANLLVDDIERIEVIRGAHSGLYGSGALGGVINIITRSGKGPLTLAMRTEAGSHGTYLGSARVSGGNDKAWGSLSLQQRRSQGFNISETGNETDASRLTNFSLRAGVKPFETVTTEVILRHVDNRADRDGYGAFAIGERSRAFDEPSVFSTKIWTAGANVKWDTLDGRLTHVFRASRNATALTDEDRSAFPFRSQNDSETVKYGYLSTLRFETPMLTSVRHTVTGLIEKERESFTPASDFADGIERSRGRLATVGEWRTDIADRLFLQGSVRHDDNDAFKDFTTWRASGSLVLREWGLRPHASVGTGVRLPTMFEQFGFIPSSFTPNPNLLPEESRDWDAGVEFSFLGGRAVLDVTYFRSIFTNKINGLAPGPGFTFTAVNLPGESTREGVEVSGRLALTPQISLGAGYTYLEARTPDGAQELRRPPHSARIDAAYTSLDKRLTVGIGAAYNGTMTDRTSRVSGFFFGFPILTPEIVSLRDYWLVTAAASYKLQPGLELYARVENVFDVNYQEVFGYNTPGLSAYAGVRLTFDDLAGRRTGSVKDR
jgi:vitamin B12 transporter